jgi:hypothetical protein
MNQDIVEAFEKSDRRFGYFLKDLFGNMPITGVEIGVHEGVHSEIMLEACPELVLFGVDMWEKHAQQKTSYLASPGTMPAKFADEDYGISCRKNAEARLRKFGDRVGLFCESSDDNAKRWSDGSFDFVYIDGDHSYEGCLHDIQNWRPKIRSGGILAGHDYGCRGVGRALKELFVEGARHNIASEKIGKCWFVVLPEK